jgi:ABC-2 type transport system ATP-binding protein
MSAADVVIAVEKLSKEYRTGVRLKRVRAVSEASFEVRRGEVFGFVGPNGAGKTTTIRVLMGLVRASAGRCLLFGDVVPRREPRARLGFLPESPYFYDYLTARELLDLCGRLFGLPADVRRKRGDELLARVGLSDAADRQLRRYSKGMLQRAGLAQALVNDPELVVLDEPMSGLDPVGRKDVRDLILHLRDAGKTIFFSTHILSDVEAICDRVAIIAGGRIHDVGPVAKLLDANVLATDVVLRVAPAGRAALEALVPAGVAPRWIEDEVTLSLPAAVELEAFLRAVLDVARVVSVTPRRESLEDLFVKRTRAS